MTKLGDFPPELRHVGILAHKAQNLQVEGNAMGIRDDLVLISHASREIVAVSKGLVAVAEEDVLKALGFIGLPLMGSFWLGYQRALSDLGLGDNAD